MRMSRPICVRVSADESVRPFRHALPDQQDNGRSRHAVAHVAFGTLPSVTDAIARRKNTGAPLSARRCHGVICLVLFDVSFRQSRVRPTASLKRRIVCSGERPTAITTLSVARIVGEMSSLASSKTRVRNFRPEGTPCRLAGQRAHFGGAYPNRNARY